MAKRVLIFSPVYFPLVGGAEVAVREITDRLPEWQFDLVCARVRRGLPNEERIGNVLVHRVGFGIPFDKFLLPFLGVWKALQLEGSREALVWSLMASYGGYASLVYTCFRPHAKMLLTLQEGDPLEHYVRRASVLSFTRAWVFRRADAVQVLSRYLADWAVKMGFRGTPVVVPNGVDAARFAVRISPEERVRLRQSFGFSDSDVVLITTSRLSLKNGVDDLIRSLSYAPESFKTLIVGEGEDREKLVRLVEELHLDSRVVFAGQRGHAELPGLLQAADIFIRPSLSESLGNSFLEAMAAGVPIVGTPVGGIPDFLEDGVTGVFCQPRDPESIAKAVVRIQTEPGLREKLIIQARETVQSRFEWNQIAKKMGDLLSALAV